MELIQEYVKASKATIVFSSNNYVVNNKLIGISTNDSNKNLALKKYCDKLIVWSNDFYDIDNTHTEQILLKKLNGLIISHKSSSQELFENINELVEDNT